MELSFGFFKGLYSGLALFTLLLWIRVVLAQGQGGGSGGPSRVAAGPQPRPGEVTAQLEILDVAENLVHQIEMIFQENNHLKAMKDQYESQTRDQRSRLSFLFQDLKSVISDIRHLRKAATFGRLCTSTETGSRMHRLHNNLINTMNEKVDRLGNQIQVLNDMEVELISHGVEGETGGGPRQQYNPQPRPTTPTTTIVTTTTLPPTTTPAEGTSAPTVSTTPEFSHQDYCTEFGQDNKGVAVFCVSTPGETRAKKDPVPFRNVDINIGGFYKNRTARLSRHPGGIFFMSVSYATFRNSPVSIATRNIKKDVTLSYGSTKAEGYNPVSLSKDIVQWIAPAKTPYVTRDAEGDFRSPFLTWIGFRLSGNMRPLVAFSAALSPTYFREQGVINFPYVLQNAGFAYNKNSSTFTAPESGIYLFTVSVAIQSESKARVRLRVNGLDKVELLQTSTNHNGVNTVTRTTLLELEAQDVVDVRMVEPGVLYSDRGLQTSFSGFLYRPSKGYQVAWSAHRSHSWLTNEPNQALDPVDFDTLLVDRHAEFNPSTGTFTCPIPGIYYVHVNMAAFPRRKLYASLVISSRDKGTQVVDSMALLRYSIRENGIDTISASTLVELQEGDSLYVRTSEGDAFYADSNLQTSFSGLLVKPTC